jgi:FolB domain-containing protein
MSQRYAACLTVHRLNLSVRLGRWDEERVRAQPVELTIKFFFPEPPPAGMEDTAEVMCYDRLASLLVDYVRDNTFLHIEYLAVRLFEEIRAHLNAQPEKEYAHARLWVRLHKINAPIPSLTGGASFVYTDLPEGVAIAHE